jgi:hypothetical protein
MEVAVPLEIDQEGVRWLIKVLRDEDASADKVLLRRLHRSVLYKDMGWRVRDKGLIFHPHTNTNTPRSEQAALVSTRGGQRFLTSTATDHHLFPLPGVDLSTRGGRGRYLPYKNRASSLLGPIGGQGTRTSPVAVDLLQRWRIRPSDLSGASSVVFRATPGRFSVPAPYAMH